MQFKKFWNYTLVFLTIVFHKKAQNIIPFSENFSLAILENNSAGQVSCEAHFSGTWTEVEGAPPPRPQRVPPFVIPEIQAVFASRKWSWIDRRRVKRILRFKVSSQQDIMGKICHQREALF